MEVVGMKRIIILLLFLFIPSCIVNGEQLFNIVPGIVEIKTDTVDKEIDDNISIYSTGKYITFDYRFMNCNDIEIQEKEKGALKEGMKLNFSVPDMPFSSYYFFDITKGNIEIESSYKEGVIELVVKKMSTEPSSIKLSNLELYTGGKFPFEIYVVYTNPLIVTLSNVSDNKEVIANHNFVIREQHSDIDYSPFFDKKIIVPLQECKVMTNNNSYILEAQPYIKDGFLMVPIESFLDAIIIKSSLYPYTPTMKELFLWNTDHTSFKIMHGVNYFTEFTVGCDIAKKGEEDKKLFIAPEIKDGILFVSLRDYIAISSASESKLKWDDKRNMVIFN